MSNDLITDADRDLVGSDPTNGSGRVARPRPDGTSRSDQRSPEPSGTPPARAEPATRRPFADADEATRVARSCRVMLGRHIEPRDRADSVAVVLAAKVMDEAVGGGQFMAIEGQPRLSARRFDHLVRGALDQLRLGTAATAWPDVEVPELVAHQILRDLGPYSMLLTAEQPAGRDTLRAMFVAAMGGDGGAAEPSMLEDPAVAERLWQLVPAATASTWLRVVASAASAIFVTEDERVVDLRDPITAVRRPQR